MKKIYLAPTFHGDDQGDGGIRRVIDAQIHHLPAYGWQFTEDPWSADVLNCHAGNYCDRNIDKPWVASSHGLYWTAEMDFGDWADPANAHVLMNLRRADVITAPTEWVAQSMRRGLCADPVVIGHGIEPEEWGEPEPTDGYVLWNKAREDVVCDPKEMNHLAAMAPDVRFVSTFGEPKGNVEILGRTTYDEMRRLVKRAGIYLCLARETFGIGTLEAMASGIPVLGWRHGGQVDIVRHKDHGYLATPGDYDSLAEGLRYCLTFRAELGAAARTHVLEHYRWADVIGQYAEVYDRALAHWQQQRRAPKVSVVVTCYKLAHLLPECLDSIASQTLADWECVVVDDASPDDTGKVAKRYSKKDGRFQYVRNETNQYLAEARNVGIGQSRGQYILPLDADDLLTPTALEMLAGALDKDRGIDIAYGHMEAWYPGRTDGPERERGGWPGKFMMEGQMNGLNQLPYASMFRRRAWERVGGYRQHIRTAEDADFWCRVSSYGFKPAKVTDAVYLIKRELRDSMSRVEPVSRDWRDWFPWTLKPTITPFGAVAPSDRREERFSYPVRSHADPVVSVVIPVGPGHEKSVIKAIDSVVAQSFVDWEVVVVADGCQSLLLSGSLAGFPFAREVETGRTHGTSAARNAGAKAARGRFLVFLDADDWLHPRFIQDTLDVWQQGQREQAGSREYIYTDSQHLRGETVEIYQPGAVACDDHLLQSQHMITTLLPRDAWAEGGFDEAMMLGWEDWDFYIGLAVKGWCSVYLPRVLAAYDIQSGSRREQALGGKDELLPYIKQKWQPYIEGVKEMGCAGCGHRSRTPAPVMPTTDQVVSSQTAGGDMAAMVDGMVMAEYLSPNKGSHSVRGQATSIQYGRRAGGERFFVDLRDIRTAPHLFRQVS